MAHQPSELESKVSRKAPPATPHWVKVFGWIGTVLVLLIVILHLTGRSPGGHTSHTSTTEHGAQHP